MSEDRNIKEYSDTEYKKWFERIYEDHFERMYRYAHAITKDKQLAEDVVSEVFFNIWNNKLPYNEILKPDSYLITSVRNLSVRVCNKKDSKAANNTYEEALKVSDTLDPESLLMGKELEEMIAEIVDKLSPHARLVYDLARNKGYSNERISKELGISKRTVETHIYNVLREMKHYLAKHFEGGGEFRHFLSRGNFISYLTLLF